MDQIKQIDQVRADSSTEDLFWVYGVLVFLFIAEQTGGCPAFDNERRATMKAASMVRQAGNAAGVP